MSAPRGTEIPLLYYNMAWDEFNHGYFDDEINDFVQDHGFDATKIALAACYPMENSAGIRTTTRGRRLMFPDAKRDFRVHVEAIIERRAGELMEENT